MNIKSCQNADQPYTYLLNEMKTNWHFSQDNLNLSMININDMAVSSCPILD